MANAEEKARKQVRRALSDLWEELDKGGKTAHTEKSKKEALDSATDSFMNERYFS